MNADDYGKLTFIIMNQEGMSAQARLDLIYKASLLMGDKEWYMGENPKVVLTQEQTVVETKPITQTHSQDPQSNQ